VLVPTSKKMNMYQRMKDEDDGLKNGTSEAKAPVVHRSKGSVKDLVNKFTEKVQSEAAAAERDKARKKKETEEKTAATQNKNKSKSENENENENENAVATTFVELSPVAVGSDGVEVQQSGTEAEQDKASQHSDRGIEADIEVHQSGSEKKKKHSSVGSDAGSECGSDNGVEVPQSGTEAEKKYSPVGSDAGSECVSENGEVPESSNAATKGNRSYTQGGENVLDDTFEQLEKERVELSKTIDAVFHYQPKEKVYYYWKQLLTHIQTNITENENKLKGSIEAKTETQKLQKLVNLLASANQLWKDRSDKNRPSPSEAHFLLKELDIYSAMADLLQLQEEDKRKHKHCSMWRDRLFWYRFFLIEKETKMEVLAKSLFSFLQAEGHNLKINQDRFVEMFEVTILASREVNYTELLQQLFLESQQQPQLQQQPHQHPVSITVTDEDWISWLEEYGPLSCCLERMIATCVVDTQDDKIVRVRRATWYMGFVGEGSKGSGLCEALVKRPFQKSDVEHITGWNKILDQNKKKSFCVRLSSDKKTFVVHYKHGVQVKIFKDKSARTPGYHLKDEENKKKTRFKDIRQILFDILGEFGGFKALKQELDGEIQQWRVAREKGGEEDGDPLQSLVDSFEKVDMDMFDMFRRQFKLDDDKMEEITLLKNKDSTLPLDVKKIRSVALVGPLAESKKFTGKSKSIRGVLNYYLGSHESVHVYYKQELQADITVIVLGTEGPGKPEETQEAELKKVKAELKDKKVIVVFIHENDISLDDIAKKMPTTKEMPVLLGVKGGRNGDAIAHALFESHTTVMQSVHQFLDADMSGKLDGDEVNTGLYMLLQPVCKTFAELITEQKLLKLLPKVEVEDIDFEKFIELFINTTAKVFCELHVRHKKFKEETNVKEETEAERKSRKKMRKIFDPEHEKMTQATKQDDQEMTQSRFSKATKQDDQEMTELPLGKATKQDDQEITQLRFNKFINKKCIKRVGKITGDNKKKEKEQQREDAEDDGWCKWIFNRLLKYLFLPFYVSYSYYWSANVRKKYRKKNSWKKKKLAIAVLKSIMMFVSTTFLYYTPITSLLVYQVSLASAVVPYNQEVSFLEAYIPFLVLTVMCVVVGAGTTLQKILKKKKSADDWANARLTVCQSDITPVCYDVSVKEDDKEMYRNEFDPQTLIFRERTSLLKDSSQISPQGMFKRAIFSYLGGDFRLVVVICFLVATVHSIIPGSFRLLYGHLVDPPAPGYFFGKEPTEQFVAISNVATSWAGVFSLTFLLNAAIRHYAKVKMELQNVLAVTDAKEARKKDMKCYLPMSDSNNLHYWILLRETAKKRVDHSVLVVVGVALLFDLLLGVLVVVRVLFEHAIYDVFNLVSIFDMTVLTTHLLGLIMVVVQINTKISLDTITLLEGIKLDQATTIVRLQQNYIDVKEKKKAADVGSNQAKREYMSQAEDEIERDKEAEERENDQDMLGARLDVKDDLGQRLETLEDELRVAQAHNQLVLSAISTMTVLDQPITILGLVINQEFVLKMIGLLAATGGPAVFQGLTQLRDDYVQAKSG